MFEIAERLDELRSRETGWLRTRREELVREQRRLHVEELVVTRVLDERGVLDEASLAADGLSARMARTTVETARALESLPRIAAAAHDGALSGEQLGNVVHLADETTDGDWAVRAPAVDPAELARRARCITKPTVEQSRARHGARFLRMWWTPDRGMLHLRGALADLDGAKFEVIIHQLTEQLVPPAGQPWEPFGRRAADALIAMLDARTACDHAPDHDRHRPRMAARPLLQVPVPREGPATICGIPLPDARVEQLRANATIEPVLVDEDGAVLAIGRRFPGMSPKRARAVVLRDGQCRCGRNCGVRHDLEIHHLVPRSWGGSDDVSNLASVFAGHHAELIPHGPWALVGNANRPDGLRRVLYADLSAEAASRHGLPPPPGRRR